MAEMTYVSRRGVLIGLGSLLAAPAIVRASSLMPVRAIEPDWSWIWEDHWARVHIDFTSGRCWIDGLECEGLLRGQWDGRGLQISENASG